jgi:hypothetical protein
MGQFPRARPQKAAKPEKRLPPVTVHVFVPSGSMTAAVKPEPICTCGSAWSSRVHDQREPEEIYTPIDSRRIGEGHG